MLRNTRIVLIAWSALWLASSAVAQTSPTTRIRGTISAVDGASMTVTTREGPQVAITFTEPLTVSAVKNVELASVQPGSYIGTAAERGPDGQ